MKTYKGFDEDMTCKGFQYEEGKSYEKKEKIVCENGFHACEYPLDCFRYYSPNKSVYHEVEQNGEISKDSRDTKVVSTKIKIDPEINIAGLVKVAIAYIEKRINPEAKSDEDKGAVCVTGEHETASTTGTYGYTKATGECGIASATGSRGAAKATGDKGVASVTGECGAAKATGNYGIASATEAYGATSMTGEKGVASATGTCGAASATGKKGVASATGYGGATSATGKKGTASATGVYGTARATGNGGMANVTGNYGTARATGSCGTASVTGYMSSAEAGNSESIAVAWGYHGKAKGVVGSHLVFSDWEEKGDNNWTQNEWNLKGAKLVRVDGKTIKENVWYTMLNGEVVEVE